MSNAFSAPAKCALWEGERVSHFHLFDNPTELATFARAQNSSVFEYPGLTLSFEEAIKRFAEGDMAGVAKSDALLSKFEQVEPQVQRKKWIDDIAGAIPNVQAHLAGHPMAMRRKTRVDTATAPIAIVVDIGAQAGVTPEMIQARGAAILALVRALSASRPVELWAGAGLDADGCQNASWNFCRIETAPLDLAHAAYILTDPHAIRRVLWACAKAHGFSGETPYGKGQKHATEAITRALIAPAFTHVQDLIVLPRISTTEEESITNPVAWIEKQLAKYASDREEAA